MMNKNEYELMLERGLSMLAYFINEYYFCHKNFDTMDYRLGSHRDHLGKLCGPHFIFVCDKHNIYVLKVFGVNQLLHIKHKLDWEYDSKVQKKILNWLDEYYSKRAEK